MKCVSCDGKMTSTRETHRYTESGLANVILQNVEVRRCAACGERELVIPKVDELHRLIARAVIRSKAKLVPEEVRFLRKWLGYSATDFALVMGVRPETVSRWEKANSDHPITSTAERLLRLMVSNDDPLEKYPIDLFKLQPRVKTEPLKFKGPDWKRAVA